MALIRKLKQSGFSLRQAKSLGLDAEEILAAGSTINDATQITRAAVVVSDADGTKGVKLPTHDLSNTGFHMVVQDEYMTSGSASFGIKIYPASGEEIMSFGVNTPITVGIGTNFFYSCEFPVLGKKWIYFNA